MDSRNSQKPNSQVPPLHRMDNPYPHLDQKNSCFLQDESRSPLLRGRRDVLDLETERPSAQLEGNVDARVSVCLVSASLCCVQLLHLCESIAARGTAIIRGWGHQEGQMTCNGGLNQTQLPSGRYRCFCRCRRGPMSVNLAAESSVAMVRIASSHGRGNGAEGTLSLSLVTVNTVI